MSDLTEEEKREKKNAYARAYYAANSAKTLERNRVYLSANLEKRAAYARRYRAANKSRASANERRRKYGISQDQLDQMVVAQNDACAICRSDFSGTLSNRFHVDHCHETKAVRGLLCQPCNMALGLLKDNSTTLLRAVDYLRASQSKDTLQ